MIKQMSNIYQSHSSHIHIKAQIQPADVFIKGPASTPSIRQTAPIIGLNLHCKIFICVSAFVVVRVFTITRSVLPKVIPIANILPDFNEKLLRC